MVVSLTSLEADSRLEVKEKRLNIKLEGDITDKKITLNSPDSNVYDYTENGTVIIENVASESYYYRGNSLVIWRDIDGGRFVNESPDKYPNITVESGKIILSGTIGEVIAESSERVELVVEENAQISNLNVAEGTYLSITNNGVIDKLDTAVNATAQLISGTTPENITGKGMLVDSNYKEITSDYTDLKEFTDVANNAEEGDELTLNVSELQYKYKLSNLTIDNTNNIVINLTGNLTEGDLTINAPSASINNYTSNGTFYIEEIGTNTWHEYSFGNRLSFTGEESNEDTSANIIISGKPFSVNVNTSAAKIKLEDNANVSIITIGNYVKESTIIANSTIGSLVNHSINTSVSGTGIIESLEGTQRPNIAETVTVNRYPLIVSNSEELEAALKNERINLITLNFDAGDILVKRKVNLDLNGFSAGNISYDTNAEGHIQILNTNEAKLSTIDSLNVKTPNATFSLRSNIEVQNETVVDDVAIGTFNTQATHNGILEIKDTDGGSVNFTNATINNGIEVKTAVSAVAPLNIRGQKPVGENATITLLGISPNVTLQGTAQSVVIKAENSTFHLDSHGDAENITISDEAKRSTITTSKEYQFELLFNEGDTVGNVMESGLFGDEEIRIIGYPSETENISEAYLLKLDAEHFSTVYTLEEMTLDTEGAISTKNGKLFVSKNEKKLYFEGEVTGEEVREYIMSLSQTVFEVSEDWYDGKVVMSIYDVKDKDIQLITSDSTDGKRNTGMRVLVGSNDRHGLYILTQNK